MGQSAGTVSVILDADMVRLHRKMERAAASVQNNGRKMQSSMTKAMSRISTAVKGMAVGMALAFGRRLVGNIVEAGLAMDRFGRTFKVAMGSTQLAGQEMEWVTELANRLGVDLLTAAGAYAKLTAAAKGTTLAGQGTRDIFESLSGAVMVLGLNAQDAGQILTAVEQMISKGKVAAEELRRQMQKMPGAFKMAARAMGMTSMELDKALKLGKVTAEEMLPALSKEINKTFGPGVADASEMAQASFARFGNAMLSIKASIAKSGVMQALADLAEAFAGVFNPALPVDIQKTQDRIDKLTKRIAELKLVDPASRAGERAGTELNLFEDQLDVLNKKMDGLLVKQGNLLSPEFGAAVEKDPAPIEGVEALVRQYETVTQKFQRQMAEISVAAGLLPDSEIQRMVIQARDEWLKATELKEFPLLPIVSQYKKSMDTMSEYSKQAARNMQDAFADFLFDPFAEGLKGMLKGFLDVIRRMIAEQAAANLFGNGRGVAKFFGLFGSGVTADSGAQLGAGNASGGPVSAGVTYPVGEKGVELFRPSQNGVIIPNHDLGGGGGVTVNQSYSIAAGADWETLQKILPPLFEQNRQATIGEILRLRTEGAF